tara:strand:- start:992 stop:1444 length:453 start_codon:yes stop_codon:yes gene_type:complete
MLYFLGFTAYAQLRKNTKAPNFDLTSFNGLKVQLETSQSKVTIINFWASWCGPCIKSLDRTIIPLYNKYNRLEVNIIGISNDLKEEKWRAAIEKYNIPWVNIWDEDRSLVRAYQVPAIPTYFLVNQKGIIIDSNVYANQLKSAVKKALKN